MRECTFHPKIDRMSEVLAKHVKRPDYDDILKKREELKL